MDKAQFTSSLALIEDLKEHAALAKFSRSERCFSYLLSYPEPAGIDQALQNLSMAQNHSY